MTGTRSNEPPALVVVVLDPAGQPIPSAEVHLVSEAFDPSNECLLVPGLPGPAGTGARTDDRGEVRFPGGFAAGEFNGETLRLEPGQRVIVVASRGLDAATSPVVRLGRPGESRATVTLIPPSRPRSGRGAIVATLSQDDRPASGRELLVFLRQDGSTTSARVVTDERGRFAVRDLEPGPFDLRTYAGEVPVGFDGVLAAGDVLERTIVVPASARPPALRGRLVLPPGLDPASVEVTATTSAGSALEVEVTGDGYVLASPSLEVWEQIRRLERVWRITALARGYVPVGADVDLTTASEGPALALGAGATVRGRVILPVGADPERCRVGLRTTEGVVPPGVPFDGSRFQDGLVLRSDGSFEVRGVAAGLHAIQVVTEDASVLRSFEVDARQAGGRALVDLGVFEVAARSGSIVGRVVDAAGRLVPGANVAAGTAHTLTDEDGAFRLDRVAPGRLPLSAGGGGLRGRGAVEVVDGRTSEVTIVLDQRATTIAGEVRLPDALRGGTLVVAARTSGDGLEVAANVGRDGAFTLAGVAAGRIEVTLAVGFDGGPLSVHASRPLELEPGGQGHVVFDLSGAVLALHVGLEGAPARAEVLSTCRFGAGDAAGEVRSGTGEAVVSPGRVAVTVSVALEPGSSALVHLDRMITVLAGEPASLIVRWPAAEALGTLTGRRPVGAGGVVHAIGDGVRGTGPAAPAEPGEVPFSLSLPAGRYRVLVAAGDAAPEASQGVVVDVWPGATTDAGLVPLAR